MKFKLFPIAAVAVALLAISFTSPRSESISIGTDMPQMKWKMPAVDGSVLSLEDLHKPNGLLVVFSCNTCPFVVGRGENTEGWEGRYQDLYNQSSKRNIGMVLINSNEAKRDNGDSMDDMKAHAKEVGYGEIPYLLDKNHVVADSFGAKTTPHVFLFNKDKKLIYKGAIDDNEASADDVENAWLKNALSCCPTGEPIDPNVTKAVGCSIKRVK